MADFKKIADKYTFHWALGGDDQAGGVEQNKNELLMFCEFLKENNIKSILEIGMAQGFLSKFFEECGFEVTGATLDESLLKYRPKKCFIGDSKKLKITGKFDLVFVDGDHSYEGVKSDYMRFKKKGKWMAFHDILGFRDCEGVKKFWQKVRGKGYKQFIDKGNRSVASGIGVIRCS